jgi:serine/alanine adding enzyme
VGRGRPRRRGRGLSGWLDAAAYERAWEAGGDRDPYFHPRYLEAAAALEDAEPAAFAHGGLLHAFLVRPLPGGACDITTPYGYGGPQGAEPGWREPFRAACAERRVVSEFIRFHPLRGNEANAGADVTLRRVQETVTVDVGQDDEAILAQMAPAGRTAVRKAQKAGVDPVPSRDLGRFRAMYLDTMHRVGADERYLFPEAFFERVERMGDGVLMLDAGCAAGLFLAGGGAMHYFLSASTKEGRALSATNAVLYAAMRHAREAGLRTLHLGGGLSDGDNLHRFKQSVGAGRATFFVGAAVHDAAAYEALTAAAGGGDGERFPAYRR